jgi:flagellar hook assembly protein FlgD
MKNETDFLFTVTGINRPSECKIKIYSVSGRLVKTISSLASTGYNQVHWDGRDNEGDYMANGVYFYKMIIDGELKKETSVQKLVILK